MFRIEFHVLSNGLIVECIEHHPSGVIGRVAGPLDGCLTVLPGVASKVPLGDPAFGSAAEGNPHVLEFVDCPRGVSYHDLDGILIPQVIAALDRIKEMPFPSVLLFIAQSGGYPSLSCP